jgi:hypothetical protein
MINYPAVRAYSRLLAPKMELINKGEEMDRGFDAGEFSGVYHTDARLEAVKEVEAVVCRGFGLEVEDLLSMLYEAEMEAIEHMTYGSWK